MTTNTGQGITQFNGGTITIINNTLYDGTTSKGTAAANLESVSFCICRHSTSTVLFVKGLTTAYIYSGSTPTHITDANYPATTVPGCVYLDGYVFVMDSTGIIYNCDLEDPTTWNALGFIEAETEKDGGTMLAKYKNQVMAIGKWTTEFFYDASVTAPASPLSRIDSSFFTVGSDQQYSLVVYGDDILFVGQHRSGSGTNSISRNAIIYDGTGFRVLSDTFVDKVLDGAIAGEIIGFILELGGHSWYCLSIPSLNRTLVYDIANGFWSLWSRESVQSTSSVTSITLGSDGFTATVTQTAHGYLDGDPILVAGANQAPYNGNQVVQYVDANHYTYLVSGSPATPATGTITSAPYSEIYLNFIGSTASADSCLLLGSTSGIVYKFDPLSFSDTSGPINFGVVTPNVDFGVNHNKVLQRLSVVGDKVTNYAYVRYSNDDYTTWSSFRSVNMALDRSKIDRLGRARRRSFHLKVLGDTEVRLEGIELELDSSRA